MILGDLWRALKAGEEVANPESWKNKQITAGHLVTLIGGVLVVLRWVGVHVELSPEDIVALAGAGAVILGLFTSVATAVSSKRASIVPGVVVPPVNSPEAPARVEGVGD